MAKVKLAAKEGVLLMSIDHPPVNALSSEVTSALAEGLHQALAERNVRAIVVTGSGGNFVGGADISRLERIASGEAIPAASPLGDLLLEIERAKKPIVAAIDGFALGGGLELALACHARIGTPRARVGLPELALGLIPGAGGTQRLARIAGLEAALDCMLESRAIEASKALELGALDELTAPETLLDRASALALELADGTRPLRRSLELDDRLPPFERAEEIVAAARARAGRRWRNVRHPFACLEAVLAGIELGPEQGLIRERALFAELLGSEAARALIHLFFAERAAPKVPGVTDTGRKPRAIARAHVLGGGTMGSGIATALLLARLEVRVVERSGELAAAARDRIRVHLDRSAARGRLSRDQADQALARLVVQSDWSGLETAELVIEAATEDRVLKREIFAELGRLAPSDAILASNTSTIDIGELAGAAGRPARVIGMHFFSPAHVMKLVEVVRTERTALDVVGDSLGLLGRMKKIPITVQSCTGFLVNRIFAPYSRIAGFLIDRGIDPYRIDQLCFDFGMPMGPCRMSDLAGIDVGLAAGAILDAAQPERGYRSALRRLLAEAGRLGEKSGKGHYAYQAGNAVEDPELGGFVLRARELAGNPERLELDDEEIVRLLMLGVANEACRALEDGIVLRSGDIDVASVQGMGFPAYRGGVLWWADRLGAKVAYETLARWHGRFPIGLFQPSELLVRAAKEERSLLD
jgi:enoyl-CoA hydratase/3-hydroxyacyl-CoA dehydrogenase